MIIDIDVVKMIEGIGKAQKMHNAYIDYNDHAFKYAIRLETSYDAEDHRLSVLIYVSCIQDDCGYDLCVHTEVEDL